MKVWFFKDRRKSSSGWKNIFYAVTVQGCHMTDGKNLAEAVYMAHDLVACLKENSEAGVPTLSTNFFSWRRCS